MTAAAVVSGLVRNLSFQRRSKGSETKVFHDPESKTPRITPRHVTPRTQELSIELERSSKSEPLGLKFALVSDYYSGVIITETSAKTQAAGLKPGDCVTLVGSKAVHSVEDCEDSLKRIAGSVELLISRAKKLPHGWVAQEENGRTVLKLRTFQPTASAPQSARSQPTTTELKVVDLSPGTRGMTLKATAKGHTAVSTIAADSVFAKHVRPGDKIVTVNGQDVSTNPLGAGRAMREASGTLIVCGSFIAPTPECAATDCPCCTVIFGHRCERPVVASKPAVEVTEAVDTEATEEAESNKAPAATEDSTPSAVDQVSATTEADDAVDAADDEAVNAADKAVEGASMPEQTDVPDFVPVAPPAEPDAATSAQSC